MRIVIIGGEAAGMSAAAKARRMIKEAEIVVYEATPIISFGACGLPYYVADEFEDSSYMAEFTPEFFQQKGIDVKINHRVRAIDPIEKQLSVQTGETIFTDHYDRLLIATGAREVIPPIQGLAVGGVFSLRRMEDGIALKAAVNQPEYKKIVVIGSGFIGLEITESMVQLGKEVRLIERADRVIPEGFDSEITDLICHELIQKGVQVHLSESVLEIIGPNKVTGIRTDKDHYAADLIIICTGVKPDTEFVAELGFEQLSNGALCVNRYGETSIPDIFAVGDCATVWHQVRKESVYIPLATVANKFGRIVGENLAGIKSEFPGVLGAAAVKVLDLEAGRTGLLEREARSMGIDYRTVMITDKNHAVYCKGQSDLHIKLVYRADSKQILGGQIIGKSGAVHRLHALSVAITMGLTTEGLGYIDFAYAPPFARTWDVLNVVGNVAR